MAVRRTATMNFPFLSLSSRSWPRLLAALAFLFFVGATAQAQSTEEKAQTVIHMLDYVSVDYPEAVRDGKVADESEYREQREFGWMPRIGTDTKAAGVETRRGWRRGPWCWC